MCNTHAELQYAFNDQSCEAETTGRAESVLARRSQAVKMESAVILQLLQPMQIERIVNFRSQRIFFRYHYHPCSLYTDAY